MKKGIITMILISTLLFSHMISGQSSRENEKQLPPLDVVHQAIMESGAAWIAAETSVSKLPPQERRFLYGAPIEKTFVTIAPQEQLWQYPGQPQRFDWRDMDGQNWMTPIRNQGGCGSCVAFMALGTVEGMADIYHGDPSLNLNLSEQHLFSCGGGTCENGLNRTVAFQYLLDHGVPDEACFPYASQDLACSWTCDGWQSRATKISCWNWVGGTSNVIPPAVIKEKLLQGPLAVTMMVYGDFNYYNGGVYEHVSGDPEAGHGIVLVGWDDTTVPPCWICKNSWGTGWGEAGGGQPGGWFRIKMGDNQCGLEEGVIFTVLGDLPEIQISENFHDFGAVEIGDTARWSLPVTNNGEADLVIQRIDFDYGEFGVEVAGFPQYVNPGETLPLPLIFTPTITDVQPCIAKIQTNDCLEPVIDIRLLGFGLHTNIVVLEAAAVCGYPGETLLLPIGLDNQQYKDIPCSRVDITLTFDSTLLSILEVTPTGRTQGLDTFEWQEPSAGTLTVTTMDTTEDLIGVGTGSIATIHMTISSGAQFGQYSEIIIEDQLVLDAAGEPVQVEIEDSIVSIYCRGDVNLDGSIDVLDMIKTINFILRVGNPPTDFEHWAADCTGDDDIDVLDVLGIANALLGNAPCQP